MVVEIFVTLERRVDPYLFISPSIDGETVDQSSILQSTVATIDRFQSTVLAHSPSIVPYSPSIAPSITLAFDGVITVDQGGNRRG